MDYGYNTQRSLIFEAANWLAKRLSTGVNYATMLTLPIAALLLDHVSTSYNLICALIQNQLFFVDIT